MGKNNYYLDEYREMVATALYKKESMYSIAITIAVMERKSHTQAYNTLRKYVIRHKEKLVRLQQELGLGAHQDTSQKRASRPRQETYFAKPETSTKSAPLPAPEPPRKTPLESVVKLPEKRAVKAPDPHLKEDPDLALFEQESTLGRSAVPTGKRILEKIDYTIPWRENSQIDYQKDGSIDYMDMDLDEGRLAVPYEEEPLDTEGFDDGIRAFFSLNPRLRFYDDVDILGREIERETPVFWKFVDDPYYYIKDILAIKVPDWNKVYPKDEKAISYIPDEYRHYKTIDDIRKLKHPRSLDMRNPDFRRIEYETKVSASGLSLFEMMLFPFLHDDEKGDIRSYTFWSEKSMRSRKTEVGNRIQERGYRGRVEITRLNSQKDQN